MALRLSFVNFWNGAFTAANNAFFLLYAFQSACGEIEITQEISSADVVVSSVCGRQPVPREKTILFVGENVRPNLATCRYALSFDYDSYDGRNFRLPLWWWRLAWPGFAEYWDRRPPAMPGHPHGHEQLIPIETLMQPRSDAQLAARKFCVLIASHPEGLRINLFHALRTLGPVAGFGRVFGNVLLQSKFEVLPSFRFCLCPENGVYPGYHTEKIVDAWYGGCIPLYSGDRLLSLDFNPAALVNYQDYLDTARFLAEVRRLDSDPVALAAMYAQPLLLRRPSLDPLLNFLREAVAIIRSSGSNA